MPNQISEEEFQNLDRTLLGARIRQARTERGLTQADLAGDDLTVGYISLIESGQRLPGRKVLGKLLDQLGLTLPQIQNGPKAPLTSEAFYNFESAEELLASGDIPKIEEYLQKLNSTITKDVRIQAVLAETARIKGETHYALELSAQVILNALAERRWVPAERALVTFSRCINELNAIYLALNHISQFENYAIEKDCPDHLFMATLEVIKAGFLTAIGDTESARVALRNVREKWTLISDDEVRGRMFWSESTLASVEGNFNSALEMALKARELLKPVSRDIDDSFLLLNIAGIINSINEISTARDKKLAQMIINTLRARIPTMSPILQARSIMAISNLQILAGQKPVSEAELLETEKITGVKNSIHELYFILAYSRWLMHHGQSNLISNLLKRIPRILKSTDDPAEYSEPLNLIGRVAESVGDQNTALTCYKYSIKANWNI